MSKSAIFAGLGQGLMALGQGAGKAIETMSFEKLRQQNLESNWARQDAARAEDRQYSNTIRQEDMAVRSSERNQDIQSRQDFRQEDMAIRKTERGEDRALSERRLDVQEQRNEGLMDYRLTQLQNDEAQRLAEEKASVPEKTKVQIDVLATELKSLVELGDSDTPRAQQVRSKIDSLLGVEGLNPSPSGASNSTIDGLSSTQVIQKIMDANDGMSRVDATRMAKSKGYIQ